MSSVAPRARGSTVVVCRTPAPDAVRPARAEMDRRHQGGRAATSTSPRTGGDGPRRFRRRSRIRPGAPHARGYTRPAGRLSRTCRVRPAHGDVPIGCQITREETSFPPRARGDAPTDDPPSAVAWRSAAHARGYTGREPVRHRHGGVCPARVGMDPGGDEGREARLRLPRYTRGWAATRGRNPVGGHTVAPRGAGMDLRVLGAAGGHHYHPAPAGMVRRLDDGATPPVPSPRTRGDAPGFAADDRSSVHSAPHARGCAVVTNVGDKVPDGCPARAGDTTSEETSSPPRAGCQAPADDPPSAVP